MPCNDGYGPSSSMSNYANELERERNTLRALLCEACGMIENGQYEMSVSLRKWWKAHKRADAKRRQELKEQKILRGIAKKVVGRLTPEEKEALAFVGVVLPSRQRIKE